MFMILYSFTVAQVEAGDAHKLIYYRIAEEIFSLYECF